jgi:hypothetical protein
MFKVDLENSWPIFGEASSLQIVNKKLAYCITFDNIPEVTVWTMDKNGELDKCISSTRIKNR